MGWMCRSLWAPTSQTRVGAFTFTHCTCSLACCEHRTRRCGCAGWRAVARVRVCLPLSRWAGGCGFAAVAVVGQVAPNELVKSPPTAPCVRVRLSAVARDDFCESTVGFANEKNGEAFQRMLDCPTFRVGSINDVAGVELCGALKNVVALGAGFCDGLGMGGNTKAAIIRIGLKETIKFAKMFFDGVKDDTFLESCGLADLVTTCFGGRNRKCAEAFAKGEGDWDALEKAMLNGQKLQGTITSKDVNVVLQSKNLAAEFPLFTRINEIAFEGKDPKSIVDL